jgi:hypothetical protein
MNGRKLFVVFLTVMFLLPALASRGARAEEGPIPETLAVMSRADIDIGDVTIEEDPTDPQKTLVTIRLTSYTATTYTATLHSGACGTGSDILYSLADVLSGGSTTVLDDDYYTVTAGDWHVAFVRTGGDGPETACADKRDFVEVGPDSSSYYFTAKLEPVNRSDVSGTGEVIRLEENTTRVEIALGEQNKFYEAIARSGTCFEPGDTILELADVVDGRSSSRLEVPIGKFALGKWHLAVVFPIDTGQNEIKNYASCGNLILASGIYGMPSTNGPIYGPPPPSGPGGETTSGTPGMPTTGAGEGENALLVLVVVAVVLIGIGAVLRLSRRHCRATVPIVR